MFVTKFVTSLQRTRLCRSNGIWFVTMHRESRRLSPQQAPDKVVDLSRTQIMKVGDVICAADFHDLFRDKSVTLSGTCRGICRKVGVMEFGLYPVPNPGNWYPFICTDF